MLTSLDAWNIDGASYFAHAIGTHNTYIQDDYWTAVDDRSPAENPGAGMLGTAGFVAGCIYRYFAFDVEQMRTNLLRGRQEGPELDDLVRRTVEALVWAGIGWPTKDTAKQHSLATFERPACVLLVMRDHGTPLSLFSAFDPGVVQDRGEGLVAASVRALDRQWGRVTLAYEEERSNLIAAFCTTDNLVNLKDPQVESNGKLASILRAWLEG
jgi:CRISPR system Cascade subunit CasC